MVSGKVQIYHSLAYMYQKKIHVELRQINRNLLAVGTIVDYVAYTQTWTLTPAKASNAMTIINNPSISNGVIELYLVAHDKAGNSSGDMNGNYLKVSQATDD